MRKFALLLILLLGAGCTTPGEQQNDEAEELSDEADEQAEATEPEQPEADEEPAPPPAPMWSEEGLEEQERMGRLEPHDEFAPGSTEWEEVEFSIPGDLDDPDEAQAPTPGALVVQLVAALEVGAGLGVEVWEQTFRVHQEEDDQAVGVIMQWGFKDDSLAGADYRAHMKRADAGWYIDRLEQRFHCARGVSDGGLCL